MNPAKFSNPAQAVRRVRVVYAALILVMAVFGVRLFYVQVLRYDHYKTAALNDQLQQYQIPAQRGLIMGQIAGKSVPIVLNQELFTLYADPTYIKKPGELADKVARIIGGSADKYEKQFKTKNTRYVVIANKLTPDQNKKILALKSPGLGSQAKDYRTYPQGTLLAQTLGFVDNDGVGRYGLEQAMNKELSGAPGELRAVTDVNGVPLAATKGNIQIAPTDGKDIVTSVDLSMQAQMEQILADEYVKTKSKGLSAIILDANNGQVKAMANYPTYDPAKYTSVEDPALFQNGAVTNAIEPGSTLKTLTTAAALDQGVIKPDTTFYDPAHWVVNGFTIKDIEEDGGAREQSVASTLALSLNTGVTWMLMQMGGGEINEKGINAWHSYLTDHYRLGQETGIEQGYESAGLVPEADFDVPSIKLTFAETAFGQALQVTPLQLASAFAAVVNGGTYYQPTLINSFIDASGKETDQKAKVLEKGVVSSSTSAAMLPLLQNVVKTYLKNGFSYMSFPDQYMVGGKTGTAQVAHNGVYYDDKFNGTYLGFVGGDKPQYVIVVFNTLPDVHGYAGSQAGQPVFADLAHMLINDSFVTPKR